MDDNKSKEILGTLLNVIIVLLEIAEKHCADDYPTAHEHIFAALDDLYS